MIAWPSTDTALDNKLTVCCHCRPKEHHVHDILYFVKTAFKECALEKLNEIDVVNREAFKYVPSVCFPTIFSGSAYVLLGCESILRKAGCSRCTLTAAHRYTENISSFASLAKQSSQLSQSPSTLYDAPGSRKAYSFRFAPTRPEQVDEVLEMLSVQTSTGRIL